MNNIDEIATIVVVGIVCGLAIWMLPDGGGKEIAIAGVAGLAGYLTKGQKNNSQ